MTENEKRRTGIRMKNILFYSVIAAVILLSAGATGCDRAESNKEFKIISAQIAREKADGRNWDVLPRSPDPFVKLFIGGDLVLKTGVREDTYTPLWNEKVNISYKSGSRIRIEVWDKDVVGDDLIGTWEGSGSNLAGEELSFGQVSVLIISFNESGKNMAP